MAKVISDVGAGRKITLELTEEELGTIVCALGPARCEAIEKEGRERMLPFLHEWDDLHKLYRELLEVLMAKEAVVSQPE